MGSNHKAAVAAGLLGLVLIAGLMLALATRQPASTTALEPPIPARAPITIISDGLPQALTLDDLIEQAELIVVGQVAQVAPARWNTADGSLSADITVENISADLTIYTDLGFESSTILAGTPPDQLVIRIFSGQVGQDTQTTDGEQLVRDQAYLLFLARDTGSTARIGPEHYVVFGAFQGVYEIDGGRAVAQMVLRAEEQRLEPIPKDAKALKGILLADVIAQIKQSR